MRKKDRYSWVLGCMLSLVGSHGFTQELYVFTEPASNMPARSLSIKQSAKWLNNKQDARTESRYTTEFMFGVNKNLMMHAAVTFSDMFSSGIRLESLKGYAKWRLLSNDALYHHFRLAGFAEVAFNKHRPLYDELSLDGDQGGAQAGFIATQLLHKFAISSTVSITEVLQDYRWEKDFPQIFPYEALNYTLSAGYLVLPKNYTDYKQANLNLYVELIGQRTTGLDKYFVDLAPAAQLIFNSTAKLNLGYRFQLNGNMNRMSERSWLIGFEWVFLDALKRRKN